MQRLFRVVQQEMTARQHEQGVIANILLNYRRTRHQVLRQEKDSIEQKENKIHRNLQRLFLFMKFHRIMKLYGENNITEIKNMNKLIASMTDSCMNRSTADD